MNNNSLQSFAWTRALTTLAAITIAALLSSCAHLNPPEPTPEPEPAVVEKKPPPEPIKPPPPSKLYEWWGKDYVSHIEVSINEQKARFYSGDQMVGWTTVASGIHKYPTPTGSFAVTEKVQEKKSNLYGKIYNKNGKLVKRGAKMGVHKIPAGGRFKGAPMPYFMRLTNDGIGMHAGPIPKPGNRASHGCIRMPKNLAPILYRHVDIGTPVTIKGNGPTYAKYLAKQRKSSPKPKATAVAKANPPETPASGAASTVAAPASAAGQTVPTQAIADVSPSENSATETQQPATPGMNGVTGNAPTQVTEVPPSNPAAGTEAGAAGTPTNPTADAAPAVAAPAMQSQSAPAVTGVTPSQVASPDPVATTAPAQPMAPAPTTVVDPTPAAPQAPSSTALPSMTGAPATPAPSASQPTAPVVPTQPPTAAGPTAQTEG